MRCKWSTTHTSAVYMFWSQYHFFALIQCEAFHCKAVKRSGIKEIASIRPTNRWWVVKRTTNIECLHRLHFKFFLSTTLIKYVLSQFRLAFLSTLFLCNGVVFFFRSMGLVSCWIYLVYIHSQLVFNVAFNHKLSLLLHSNTMYLDCYAQSKAKPMRVTKFEIFQRNKSTTLFANRARN